MSLLSETCRDLAALRPHGWHTYMNRVWVPESKLYLPPGLWYRAVPEDGQPVLFALPPPHHPLEVLVAQRGLGGLMPVLGLGLMAAVKELRGFPNWLAWTERIAKVLFWTPGQVRLMYHALTPLATNGGGMHDTDLIRWRQQLYKAAGLDEWYDRAGMADYEQQPWGGAIGADYPRRMGFWWDEVPRGTTIC